MAEKPTDAKERAGGEQAKGRDRSKAAASAGSLAVKNSQGK